MCLKKYLRGIFLAVINGLAFGYLDAIRLRDVNGEIK